MNGLVSEESLVSSKRFAIANDSHSPDLISHDEA